MVALSTWGWTVIDWSKYRPPHHTRAGFLVLVMIVVVMKACGLLCVWYYYQGRNWARIAVLLTSVWTLYNLRLLTHGHIPYRSVIAAEGLLGMFLLYWLNRPDIRRFFTRDKQTSENTCHKPAEAALNRQLGD